jgi:hypothetical protein
MKNYLHLVLTSDNEYYNEMYKITNEYYKNFKNVKTIYYKYSSILEDDYMLDNENNILYIKGIESHLPGILDKTLKTFVYFKNDIFEDKYDYVIRTNVSTIVNFDIMDNIIQEKNLDYGGDPLWLLTSIFPHDGIMKPEYTNIVLVQGNCIILSNSIIKEIISNINDVDMDVIDDISIAIFIKFKFPHIIPQCIHNRRVTQNCNENYCLLDDAMKHAIIQNKNIDRGIDIKQMKYMTSLYVSTA